MKSEFEKKDVEENATREKDARSKPDCKSRKLRNSMVRRLIHGWPFTSEKYNQARSILCGRYRRPSQLVKVHIKLSIINGTNARKSMNFTRIWSHILILWTQ